MYENFVYDNASLIFPIIHPLPEVLNNVRLREDVLSGINSDAYTKMLFQSMSPQEQEALLGFCMGNRGLKITYDPFFKHIFGPETHPGRLDMFLSSILGQKVSVKTVLPRESRRRSEEGSLVILDILVELSDKNLVNVEMQRIGYDFPSERSFCYGADLLVRQYDLVREEMGEKFSYKNIRPVCIIVLMEKSPGLFHQKADNYIHRSEMIFDTGINMKNLLNFIYISLDIFRENIHNKGHKELTEQDAWLYFLSSDNPQDILHLTKQYPMFRELYQDIINFRYHPRELMNMFSEALAIMDKNTELYMIDQMKKEIKKKDADIAKKDAAIYEKDTALAESKSENERLRKLLAQYESEGKSSKKKS